MTGENDFEGYRIYRSTDPEFRDPQVLTTGRGTDIGLRNPTAIFDLADGRRGYSQKAVEGIQYYLGEDTGISHTWTDTTVTNGQVYYYAVTSYDFGVESPYDSLRIFPSENPITVTRTPRGGLILPKNVVEVRPDPRVLGFQSAMLETPVHVEGASIQRPDRFLVCHKAKSVAGQPKFAARDVPNADQVSSTRLRACTASWRSRSGREVRTGDGRSTFSNRQSRCSCTT